MAANFACTQCSEAAVVFCTCSGKVFLCGQCIGGHGAKPGAHVYANLDAHSLVDTVADLPKYTLQTQTQDTLRLCISQLQSLLQHEKASFQHYYTLAYQDLTQKLSALQALQTHTDQLYSHFESQIDSLITDLMDASLNFPDFLNSPSHFSEFQPQFFDFQTAIQLCYSENGYSPSSFPSLNDCFSMWNFPVCDCEKCNEIRKILPKKCMNLEEIAREIKEKYANLPFYQCEEAAVRWNLTGKLEEMHLIPLLPGQKKQKLAT